MHTHCANFCIVTHLHQQHCIMMEQLTPEESDASQQYTDLDRLLGSSGGKENVNYVNDTYVSWEDPGTDGPDEFKTYRRRWYVLAVYALLALLQCVAWNSWGPIADTSKLVLSWTDGDIALLTNWGPITFVVSALFFSWILDTKGLRFSVVITAFIMLLGLGVRCLPVGISNMRWTMNVGQFLIGLAGPVFSGAPTIVSAVWFPPHQRTTATAISAMAIYLGVAVSFLIGPQIVTDITIINSTRINPVNAVAEQFEFGTAIDPAVRNHHFNQIMLLMYIECGAGAFLAFCTLIYFPARPPTPPSVSASSTRESFKKGALHLAKSGQFWLISLAYCLSTGLYGAWDTQLDTLFQHADGVDQDTVGWIGFYGSVAGSVGGVICASFVDRLGGYMKRMLLLLAALATASGLWCVLLLLRFIPFHIVHLYVSCIALSFFITATIPIYFEMAVEGVYPISEGITTMVLTLMNNSVGLLFLLVPIIPGIGVDWMNWSMLGGAAVAVPLLLLYRENYNRMKQDVDDTCSVNRTAEGT